LDAKGEKKQRGTGDGNAWLTWKVRRWWGGRKNQNSGLILQRQVFSEEKKWLLMENGAKKRDRGIKQPRGKSQGGTRQSAVVIGKGGEKGVRWTLLSRGKSCRGSGTKKRRFSPNHRTFVCRAGGGNRQPKDISSYWGHRFSCSWDAFASHFGPQRTGRSEPGDQKGEEAIQVHVHLECNEAHFPYAPLGLPAKSKIDRSNQKKS